MKMDTIVYRMQFSNDNIELLQGFMPFKKEDGTYVYQRDVTCHAVQCESDVAVVFFHY